MFFLTWMFIWPSLQLSISAFVLNVLWILHKRMHITHREEHCLLIAKILPTKRKYGGSIWQVFLMVPVSFSYTLSCEITLWGRDGERQFWKSVNYGVIMTGERRVGGGETLSLFRLERSPLRRVLLVDKETNLQWCVCQHCLAVKKHDRKKLHKNLLLLLSR